MGPSLRWSVRSSWGEIDAAGEEVVSFLRAHQPDAELLPRVERARAHSLLVRFDERERLIREEFEARSQLQTARDALGGDVVLRCTDGAARVGA